MLFKGLGWASKIQGKRAPLSTPVANMQLPQHPVTLTPEQIQELNARLSTLRHNVNNNLSLIVAATELLRRKPEMAARFLGSLQDPPQRITEEVKRFSDELEKVLGIVRMP